MRGEVGTSARGAAPRRPSAGPPPSPGCARRSRPRPWMAGCPAGWGGGHGAPPWRAMTHWPCFQTAGLSARPLLPRRRPATARLPCATAREPRGFHATAQSPWPPAPRTARQAPEEEKPRRPAVASPGRTGVSIPWPCAASGGNVAVATHWACQGRTGSLRDRGPAAAIGPAERAGPRPSCRNLRSPKGLMRRGPVPGLGGIRTQSGWSRGQRGGDSLPRASPRPARLQGICRPHKAAGSSICAVGLPLQPPGPSHLGTALTAWGPPQTALE